MVKIRIISKYAQFEFENDLEKSTFEILSYSPKVTNRNKDESKKYQSTKNPGGKINIHQIALGK
jgi:hypothetical protein